MEIVLTPRGALRVDAGELASTSSQPLQAGIVEAFGRGAGHGLLYLGANTVGIPLPPSLAFWRDVAVRYVTAVCAGGIDAAAALIPAAELATLIAAAPLMLGNEYLSVAILECLWGELAAALGAELAESGGSLQDFLKERHPAWNLVGRVHFNLAENRKDESAPFAFIATYTSRLSAHAKAQHQPLGAALQEYADGKSHARLLALLLPVQRAAEQCPWLRSMVDTGEIYHPLRWTPGDALQLLMDLPKLEAAGVVVRTPATWPGGRPARAQVQGRLGARPPSQLGAEALLDFSVDVTLQGQTLSAAEIKRLLAASEGLQLIRGHWVEVDRQALTRLLERFQGLAREAAEGLPFAQAMRLLAGASVEDSSNGLDPDWSQVVAGPWLAETLQGLRSPAELAQVSPGADLHAILRPYQIVGVRWLYLLYRLRLGACLADDMGLGKTLQVLALLLVLKRERSGTDASRRPSLLVAPASLLGNWVAEIERFAPGLRFLVAHPSVIPAQELKALPPSRIAGADFIITSYATLTRVPALLTTPWDLVVLDEAQAIKNPAAQQSRAVKRLQAHSRIALTGTPVENSLGDLWSIFDFTHPGLLGSAQVFARFAKRLNQTQHFAPLRQLVSPYILRRMKTDRTVIADLPAKTELKAYCSLSATQAALYQRAVKELAAALAGAEGMQRRGTVLAFLMRVKQICNHASQWLGDGAWAEKDSGKFLRLREIAEVIAAKQEKMLLFTQFRETTAPLAAFLGGLFGREGLILHGGTAVAKRQELVRRFQDDDRVPFFVLSLKAGGAGLNLTRAAHVVHFDRWWNPAVENQATDRAFRIGQTRNVLVHKFVCRGTVEDKIDQLIEAKQRLVNEVIEGGAEVLLTEMSNGELLDLVRLDIHAAQAEG